MTIRFRAMQIGSSWYCCEIIQSQWVPKIKCPSDTAASDVAHIHNQWDNEDMYFEPFGAKTDTPAYI